MKPTVLGLGKTETVLTNSNPRNIFYVAAEGESTFLVPKYLIFYKLIFYRWNFYKFFFILDLL